LHPIIPIRGNRCHKGPVFINLLTVSVTSASNLAERKGFHVPDSATHSGYYLQPRF
jgi:hypothetical protein